MAIELDGIYGITSNGNITTDGYYFGNGYYLTGITANGSGGNYGNANVAAYLPTYTGNLVGLTGNIVTTANVQASSVIATNIVASNFTYANGSPFTGSYGNANVSNYLASGTNSANIVTTGNVTASGVTTTGGDGNISGVNYYLGNAITVTGNVEGSNVVATYLWGDGSNITNLPAGNYGDSNVEALLSSGTITGNVITTANISGDYILGNGAFLTGLGATYGNTEVADYLANGSDPTVVAIQSNVANNASNIAILQGNIANLQNAQYGNANVELLLETGITNNITTTGIITGGNISAGTNNLFMTGNTIASVGNIVIDPLNDGTPAGNVTILGNLQVTGTLTTVNANTAIIDNLLWIAANAASNPLLAAGGGLQVGPEGSPYASWTYNPVANTWNSNIGGTFAGNVNAPGATFTGNVVATNFTLANGQSIINTYSNANVTAYLPTNTANITGGNIGNASTYLYGDGSNITGISGGGGNVITFGNSNVRITTSGGNVQFRVNNTESGGIFTNRSVGLGLNAGGARADGATAIGGLAGQSQAANATAVGHQAGATNQAGNATAVGYNAGQQNQGVFAIAMGYAAGQTSQSANSVAIGTFAGYASAQANTVAIGQYAGGISQLANSVAVGSYAAQSNQGANSVAIGSLAGYFIQDTSSIAIGNIAGGSRQGAFAIAMGQQAGGLNQSNNSIAIGTLSGNNNQSINAISIGTYAGATSQNRETVAIGLNAGNSSQSGFSIAIGSGAGNASQSNYAVAIGYTAGNSTQGASAVAIGQKAGNATQAANGIGIGTFAAFLSQGRGAIAIGGNSAVASQGIGSIAIGSFAVANTQAANSIALNASGTPLTASNTGFYVKPVRNDNSNIAEVVMYNISSSELTYSSNISLNGQVVANGNPLGTAFVAGPGSSGNVALFLNGDNMAIRDNASVATSFYMDICNQGAASNAQFQWRGGNTFTQFMTLNSSSLTVNGSVVQNISTAPIQNSFARINSINSGSASGTTCALDNLNIRLNNVTGSDLQVQLSAVSGSFSAYATGQVNRSGSGIIQFTNPAGFTLTAGSWTGFTGSNYITAGGDYYDFIVNDSSNQRTYRVLCAHGNGSTTGSITVERIA